MMTTVSGTLPCICTASEAGTHHHHHRHGSTPEPWWGTTAPQATWTRGHESDPALVSSSSISAINQLCDSIERLHRICGSVLVPLLSQLGTVSIQHCPAVFAVAGDIVRQYSLLQLNISSLVHSLFSVIPRMLAASFVPLSQAMRHGVIHYDPLYCSGGPTNTSSLLSSSSALPIMPWSPVDYASATRVTLDMVYPLFVVSYFNNIHRTLAETDLVSLRSIRGLLCPIVDSHMLATWLGPALTCVNQYASSICKQIDVLQHRMNMIG